MSSLQVGSRRPARQGLSPWVYGVILAAIVVAAVAYFVAAMGGTTPYSPPNATGAPATYAPGVPATNIPAPVPTAPPAPHYP